MSRSTGFLLLFASAALTAHAGLIGTDVTLNYHFEGTSTVDIIHVDSGIEVKCIGGGNGNTNICSILTAPNQSLDFGNSTITYNYFRIGDEVAYFLAGTPNGFDFQDLSLDHPIRAVFITSTIAGLDASRLTFTEHSIQLNMSDLPLGDRESFTIRMVTNPEPSAGLLAGLGVLLVAVPRSLKGRVKA